MYNVMGALRGCREVNLDFCNNLSSSVYIILVILLRYVRLTIEAKMLLLLLLLGVLIFTICKPRCGM